ncbi:MAG: ATP-binding cassette domain-containing protein [Oscillospiraceae bacterium]|nr:ATP-binding cassette domain-containing protein [Oscillospiraceae bacterium]
MSCLRLTRIEKTYTGTGRVRALRGVSLTFGGSGFAAVLGSSGCGKTTLLNIMGGLDRYTAGDLTIRGVSTAKYTDADWDSYRNRSVGFVFQNYNLIAHQTALQNVEISLTLSGVPRAERRRRARAALESVGLADIADKLPSRLSGGQAQRVAIARALAGEPDILLCDEPTGALDTATGTQVMEILKEVSATRLVVMVTHNTPLAERYADRIIRMTDGQIVSDGNPPDGDTPAPAPAARRRGSAMSMRAAAMLSLRNLLTKKGRSVITAVAGSIGIIGVALVLALSSGLSAYMSEMQLGALSGFPLTIGTNETVVEQNGFFGGGREAQAAENVLGITNGYEPYPSGGQLHRYDRRQGQITHRNILTDEFLAYLNAVGQALPGAVNTVMYTRGVAFNMLSGAGESVTAFNPGTGGSDGMNGVTASLGIGGIWQEMPDNAAFILSLYDLLGEGSRLPEREGEIALVVDEYNRLNASFLNALGLYGEDGDYSVDYFVGASFLRVLSNDEYYTEQGGVYVAANASEYPALYEKGFPLTVTGVLRIKENAAGAFFSPGLVYTSALTDKVRREAALSAVALAQAESEGNVLTGAPFRDDNARRSALLRLGADTTPTAVSIYPADFTAKDALKEYLAAYNSGKPQAEQIYFTDLSETITNMTATLLNTVSAVLVGFAAISLLVSSIMIGIVTYVSVLERTKEIGILRSVGARKRDIARLFNAETLIIGFAAGALGVVATYLLSLPINAVIRSFTGLGGIASLPPAFAAALIAGSMALTLTAGLLPAGIASRKDPVAALRSE